MEIMIAGLLITVLGILIMLLGKALRTPGRRRITTAAVDIQKDKIYTSTFEWSPSEWEEYILKEKWSSWKEAEYLAGSKSLEKEMLEAAEKIANRPVQE